MARESNRMPASAARPRLAVMAEARPRDKDFSRAGRRHRKTAVPALEKIRDEHQSERLRNTAAKYLEQIAREVG